MAVSGSKGLFCLRNATACVAVLLTLTAIGSAIRLASASIIRCCAAVGGSAALRMRHTLAGAALPVSWQCSLISVYRGTHQCGECNNAAFGTQSAAVLSSHAPHDSKARLQTKTNRRGSWRSHVHHLHCAARAALQAQRRQWRGQGQGPLRSLGDLRGTFSHVRECPLARFPRQAGKTTTVSGRKKEGTTFRWSPIFYSLRKRSAMTAAASAVDSAPVSR